MNVNYGPVNYYFSLAGLDVKSGNPGEVGPTKRNMFNSRSRSKVNFPWIWLPTTVLIVQIV